MIKKLCLLLALSLLLAGCAAPAAPTLPPTPALPIIALVHGRLIDGTGAAPVEDAVLLIQGERILAAGPKGAVSVPPGAQVLDASGATILPGFINAHVHDAYSAERLRAWAQAGVTTVRDEGVHLDQFIGAFGGPLADALALRRSLAGDPQYARLVSAGAMLSPSGGYGDLYADSAAAVRQRVDEEAALGVEQVKFSLETGYAGTTGLPVFTAEEVAALIDEAHAKGLRVSVHVTQAAFLEQAVKAGVDNVAHAVYDYLPQDTIAEMVQRKIPLVPTLTVFAAYGALPLATEDVRQMAEGGVTLALGNDYTLIPQAGFPHFELGMPMYEIERLSDAGLSPMQIIQASTLNAAAVCGLKDELGTLEPGKQADVLVVRGNPLLDLQALAQPLWVIHRGQTILSP